MFARKSHGEHIRSVERNKKRKEYPRDVVFQSVYEIILIAADNPPLLYLCISKYCFSTAHALNRSMLIERTVTVN